MNADAVAALPSTAAGRLLFDRYSKGDPTWFLHAILDIEREAAALAATPLPSDTPACPDCGPYAPCPKHDGPYDTPADGLDVETMKLILHEVIALGTRAEQEAASLPSNTPADGLDAAWREAEAARDHWFTEMRAEDPEEEFFEGGDEYDFGVRLDSGRRGSDNAYSYSAGIVDWFNGTEPIQSADGDTPTEALRNLALALTQEPRSTREEAE